MRLPRPGLRWPWQGSDQPMNVKSTSWMRAARRVAIAGLALAVAAAARAQDPPKPPNGPPLPAPTSSEVQGYSLPAADVAATVARLQEQYTRRRDVRIVGDERLGQIVVMGPREVQHEVATWLGEQKLAASGVAVAASATTPVQPAALAGPTQPLVTQSWNLRNL